MARFLTVSVLLLLAPAALAWTPETERRIAEKSATLAPVDLRWILEHYSADFRRGLETAALKDNTSAHKFDASTTGHSLRSELLKEIADSIAGMRTRRGMGDFAERLGRITHLVGEANHPMNAGSRDQRLEASRSDFDSYLRSRQSKFPTVFYGLQRSLEPSRYVDGMIERSRRFYPLLDEEYFRWGDRRSSAEFDDRSTAFGIAAVSYSRAVSDLVNIYFYIWKQSGGDTRTALTLQKGNLLLNELNAD